MSLQVVNRLLSRVQLSPLLLPKAAADCDHSNQLTDAHNSAGAAAAATAVVEVHSTLEAIQPLDAGKTIGSVATSQGQASKDEQHDAAFLQSLFCCPVLKAAMVDPVIAADGHTYERDVIDQWLQHCDISPVTGNPLAHTRLVPNVLIRQAIVCQQQQPH